MKILIFHEDNKNETATKFETIEELGIVNYNETDWFVFFNLKHLIPDRSLIFTHEVKSYIDIHFT